jgi:hypothetical protein
MLTRIVCPHCGHIGAANAASLPRVLICSQCEHGALFKSGRPARSPSIARDEQAAIRAAWERYEVTGEPARDWMRAPLAAGTAETLCGCLPIPDVAKSLP